MPELLPTWAKISEQTGHDDIAAALLTGWDLPTFAPAGCSQVTTVHPSPSLLRNYDYAPDLFEQVSLSTDYLQPVIGTGDCLWGLLDGMNAAGLAVSLAYGGDRTSGEGFAIPIVLRYLLETCETTEQAEAALARLPIAMAYNVTMIDAQGTVRTAHLRPGHDAEFAGQPAATNHRWEQPVDVAHATVLPQRRAGRAAEGPGRRARHRRRPRPPAAHPTAARERLRRRLRHPLHRRLPTGGAHGDLPLARPRVAAHLRLTQ